MISELLLYAPEAAFIEPYIRREFPRVKISDPDNASAPELAVMISSVDIYGLSEAENADEKTPLDLESNWVEREQKFSKLANELGLRPLILRCADIIGTGMNGFPRQLVESIWRGTYFHFPGNEARRSVIHASDIANLIRAASCGLPDKESLIYNVTDCTDPSIHDFVEALAFRMKNKRVSTLSTKPQQWIGRILYGRSKYLRYTTSRTFSAQSVVLDMAFHPTPVCDYLRNHIYDDSSL